MLADVFQVPTYYIQYIHTIIYSYINKHAYMHIYAYTEHSREGNGGDGGDGAGFDLVLIDYVMTVMNGPRRSAF